MVPLEVSGCFQISMGPYLQVTVKDWVWEDTRHGTEIQKSWCVLFFARLSTHAIKSDGILKFHDLGTLRGFLHMLIGLLWLSSQDFKVSDWLGVEGTKEHAYPLV